MMLIMMFLDYFSLVIIFFIDDQRGKCSGKNLLTSVLDFGNPLTRCLTAVILST